jgi:outer membrane protein insertion porin family
MSRAWGATSSTCVRAPTRPSTGRWAAAGVIKPYAGDDVRLTDRFFLGEPQMRGFGIRGVGPRILRKQLVDSDDPDTIPDTVSTDRNQWNDDALGGKYYYLGRAELEIPLGSGARELGLRPSIFADVGAVWGIKSPELTQCNPGCNQIFLDADGNQTAEPTDPDTGAANTPTGNYQFQFVEEFVGNTWKPRLAIGIGVNWNSPFGPFRIDFSRALLKQEGDDTKAFTFNVGTQF